MESPKYLGIYSGSLDASSNAKGKQRKAYWYLWFMAREQRYIIKTIDPKATIEPYFITPLQFNMSLVEETTVNVPEPPCPDPTKLKFYSRKQSELNAASHELINSKATYLKSEPELSNTLSVSTELQNSTQAATQAKAQTTAQAKAQTAAQQSMESMGQVAQGKSSASSIEKGGSVQEHTGETKNISAEKVIELNGDSLHQAYLKDLNVTVPGVEEGEVSEEDELAKEKEETEEIKRKHADNVVQNSSVQDAFGGQEAKTQVIAQKKTNIFDDGPDNTPIIVATKEKSTEDDFFPSDDALINEIRETKETTQVSAVPEKMVGFETGLDGPLLLPKDSREAKLENAKAVRIDKEIRHDLANALDFWKKGKKGVASVKIDTLLKRKEAFVKAHKHTFTECAIQLRKIRQIEPALAFALRCTEVDPDDSHTFFNAARMHYELKNYKYAKTFIQKALVLEPDLAPAIKLNSVIDGILEKMSKISIK